MEQAFSLDYLLKQRGTKEQRDIADAIRLCREAGFCHVDYSPNFTSDDWESRAHRDRALLDAAGISVEQTHAPFNRYLQYDPAKFPEYRRRLFEASKIVGAKYVVIHADEYRTTDHYDLDEILQFSYDDLAPYAEYTEKNGMILAIENVFEDGNRRCPPIDGKSRFTSRIEELKAIIERFASPAVACCWDFGHAKCQFGNDSMLDAMKQVGNHIVCTHVHDNYYGKDLHLMPFLGEIDWESHLSYMKEIGYKGKLSFEMVYGSIPDKLLPMWLRSVHEVGNYMCDLYETGN
jgi:sugar phosphate isomerase/epimerase